MTTDDTFLSWVRFALRHLYDPSALQSSPLIEALGLSGSTNAASGLRRTLMRTIRSLEPEPDTPAHMIAAFGQFGDESHPSAAINTSRWTTRVLCQGFPLATVKPSLQTRDAIYGNIPRFLRGHDLRRNGVPAWEAESSGPRDVTRDPRQISLAVSCPRVLDGRRRGIAFPKWI